MPRTLRLLTSLAALLAIACATGPEPTASATITEEKNPPGTTEAPKPAALNTVTAEEGFVFKIPGAAAPTPQRGSVKIPSGDVATAAWTNNVDGVLYSISIADYPAATAAKHSPTAFVNDAKNGLVNQLKGTVKSEREIEISGHSGKEFTVDSPNGELVARNYFVAPRLYTMFVLYNPSIGAPAMQEFLDSLTLINPPPPPPPPALSGADGGMLPDGGMAPMGDGGVSTLGDGGTVGADSAADAGTPAPKKKKKSKKK